MSRKIIVRGWIPLLVVAAVAGGLVWSRARADGIPTQNPLYYSGTLVESGVPANGTRSVEIVFWNDPTSTALANKTCDTLASSTSVTNGRFRVPLDPGCVAAVSANPDLYVEVLVGGTSLGRKKLGAVPYAVEAQRASAAAGVLASQVVPSGAVMFFNLASCPAGWSTLPSAQGRYIVGVSSSGMLGATVGTSLADQENRAVGAHTHAAVVSDPGHSHAANVSDPGHAHGNSISDPGHSHSILLHDAGSGANQGTWNFNWGSVSTFGAQSAATATYGAGVQNFMSVTPSATGVGINNAAAKTGVGVTVNASATGVGVTVNPAGSVGGTNAPYVQLLACQKN